ncbi:carboxypeptidase regulatory-like domain-containing protein [Adhaeribacter rhizoryzae]|uniref:Carboxypeptidase regulatory-like domain-containing protein n=1 Tax=Adhaeribacter rhizoryzae TaxID=2607907 RepID=A0A5M6DP39_9BACT|nr:carboxypeptidase regulatory-like domain-containing protein [Adhaeribacter rhizoryzae]KAA5549254.1 carboxypeptidase regulatory-like domain-containing protein [Adhaeribacter rhizoryzae]
MNMLAQLFISLLLLAFAATNQQTPAGNQGILGTITVREGNFMPGPDRKDKMQPVAAPAGKVAPREIYVYELTNLKQVKASGPFYSEFKTNLVAKVTSGLDGLFRVELKPGKYSVFSKEPNGFFANRLDGDGNIYPVEVTESRLTLIDFIIDYNASY